MAKYTIMGHPLIQHKITLLRDKNTGTNEFRKLVEEIAMLMAYEALRDLPVEMIEIETPIESCMAPVISGKKLFGSSKLSIAERNLPQCMGLECSVIGIVTRIVHVADDGIARGENAPTRNRRAFDIKLYQIRTCFVQIAHIQA